MKKQEINSILKNIGKGKEKVYNSQSKPCKICDLIWADDDFYVPANQILGFFGLTKNTWGKIKEKIPQKEVKTTFQRGIVYQKSVRFKYFLEMIEKEKNNVK